jgi:hypothetical protein
MRHERERELEQQGPAAPAPEAVEETTGAERLASNVGNQAFGALARQGAGILPDGRAHPDVESTIARTRGGGSALEGGVAERVGGQLGADLSGVRVHTDATADALASSVSAKAFTTGNDIYFAQGQYDPGSGEGNRLLTHELTHVVQQDGAPTGGPLEVSQPGDPLEVKADEATRALGA